MLAGKIWRCDATPDVASYIKACALAEMSNSMKNVNVRMSYFQKVRGLHLEVRENVAETADIASLGIEYGILAFFLLLNYPSLSKIFFHISV